MRITLPPTRPSGAAATTPRATGGVSSTPETAAFSRLLEYLGESKDYNLIICLTNHTPLTPCTEILRAGVTFQVSNVAFQDCFSRSALSSLVRLAA